ncbi:response regulator [Aquibacillus sp. 3ASR75-11]|uniref:Response regulator n=1 Tax=Terrihalobacillus insolitus TaxID=2950438 RepID=A0A9X3WQU7_9BACI|nr:response regulator [Terrihalobacillus insolitus]MDC3412274.1 response regulator [Terrihalobacillus insolitus]MDC3423033.1 response regulator [Terrihalobacillus insolitus]
MILIIDDNEDIRFTIREICEFANWKVIEAASGKSGVELFTKMKPDLVIVDYHMSEWDGLKTTKELRRQNQSVPIIVLTIDERQEIANEFLNAGASDFALKPIKAPDLISRIRLNLKIGKLTKGQSEAFVEKGINVETLRTIKNFLLHQTDALTIAEIQKELPVAYQTVHRYLNHLVDKGEAEVISHYGNKGRPKNKYKLL